MLKNTNVSKQTQNSSLIQRQVQIFYLLDIVKPNGTISMNKPKKKILPSKIAQLKLLTLMESNVSHVIKMPHTLIWKYNLVLLALKDLSIVKPKNNV